MRQMVSGMVAVAALVAASVMPAMACGGWYTGGCASCLSYGSCAWGYGPGYGFAGYEHLPSPTQYYYVNQGPAFTGPGNFAPVPTYQESAVAGWNAYSRPYYYPYDGGRYAHAMHHYYDGAPAAGPDSIMNMGRLRITAEVMMPPLDCMISRSEPCGDSLFSSVSR